MKSYNNDIFLGPGTIKFANGAEISFTDCKDLEMELSYDSASSMSAKLQGATIILPREERKEMKNVNTDLRGITVKFPGSNKTYDYIIAVDGWFYITTGDKIRIMNEHFYNYLEAEVEVVNCTSTPTLDAARRIIAFTKEEDLLGWFDITWTEKVKHQWREDVFVSCFNSINPKKDHYSFDEYFKNSDKFRELFKETPIQVNKTRIDGTWAGTSIVDEWESPAVCGEYINDSAVKVDQLLNSHTTDSVLYSLTSAVDSIKSVTEKVEELSNIVKNQYEINKGDDNMNIFSNFDFGKVTKDNYAMTLKGIAYRSIGNSSAESDHLCTYVQYNPETNDFEDVTPFILDINVKDFLFKIPVATSAIKAGDIILDRQAPVFVKDVKGSEITVVDPITREVRTILATKNAFNFNFVTKIVNLMDNFNLVGSASAENPFGNILPLIMLSDNKNMKDIFPLMLLGNGSVDFASNPMMLYFLMKDGKSNDMLPFLLMSNPNLFGAQNTLASSTE